MAHVLRSLCIAVFAFQIAAAEELFAPEITCAKRCGVHLHDLITVVIDDAPVRAEGAKQVEPCACRRVAVSIASIRPNGNLLIEGRSTVQKSDEVCELSLTGEVPRQAIRSDRTVSSNDVADLRIETRTRRIARDEMIRQAAAQRDVVLPRPEPQPTIISGAAKNAKPVLDRAVKLRLKQAELARLQHEIQQLRAEVDAEQQILVRVQMLEVSLTKLRRLATDFALADALITKTDDMTGLGQISPSADSKAITGFLEWLTENDIARVVSRPRIITMDGRPASVHIGQEIPVPVEADPKSVEFRAIGTQVDVLPTAIGDDRVRLELKVRVSEADESHSFKIGDFRVPAISVRQCNTAIETSFGRSVVLNGLVEKRTEAGKTEEGVREVVNEIMLMVVVTPELVDSPMTAQRPAAYSPPK